jgi:hypothetical protein
MEQEYDRHDDEWSEWAKELEELSADELEEEDDFLV